MVLRNIETASSERRKALSEALFVMAERILDEAQHLQEQADAKHRAADLLFDESERLDPPAASSDEEEAEAALNRVSKMTATQLVERVAFLEGFVSGLAENDPEILGKAGISPMESDEYATIN